LAVLTVLLRVSLDGHSQVARVIVCLAARPIGLLGQLGDPRLRRVARLLEQPIRQPACIGADFLGGVLGRPQDRRDMLADGAEIRSCGPSETGAALAPDLSLASSCSSS